MTGPTASQTKPCFPIAPRPFSDGSALPLARVHLERRARAPASHHAPRRDACSKISTRRGRSLSDKLPARPDQPVRGVEVSRTTSDRHSCAIARTSWPGVHHDATALITIFREAGSSHRKCIRVHRVNQRTKSKKDKSTNRTVLGGHGGRRENIRCRCSSHARVIILLSCELRSERSPSA